MKFEELKLKSRHFFKKGTFRMNIATMFSGTMVSQGIYFLFYPILTRIYNPSEFGAYAIFISLLSILTLIASGQYELSILLPKKKNDYKNIVLGIIGISLVVSVLIFILLNIFSNLVINKLGWLDSEFMILILSISVFINALYQTGIYISLRKKAFKTIAIVNIINVALSILFQYVFSQIELKAYGLILGYMIGNLVAMLIFFLKSKEDLQIKEDFKLVLSNIKKILLKYKDFPFVNLPAILINLLANQSPQFVLRTFSEAVVGNFALSQKVLGSPVTLFSTSVSQVFKERASSDYRNKGNCEAIFKKTFVSLLLISVIPFVLIFIFAPQIVPLIFGGEWESAGTFIRILTLMYFLKFTVSPLTYVIVVAEKQKLNLILQVTLFVVIITSMGIGLLKKDPFMAILLYSIGYSLVYLLFLLISYRVSKGENKLINLEQ